MTPSAQNVLVRHLLIFFTGNCGFAIANPLHTPTLPARRTRHLRFNELNDPEPIPRDTDYATLIESEVPIVVQHTRLDSRQAASALLSTVAFGAE